jgi:Fe-S cluster assembly ATP-binding protein
MNMLEIRNLYARVEDKSILKGLSLTVNAGEVHAIMGPNGSGKSTLSHVIAGREGYEVTDGEVLFDGQNLLALDPEDRACAGIFLGFQYPVEIPGVSNLTLLKAAINARRKRAGEGEISPTDFLAWVRDRAKLVKIDPKMLSRGVNEGFSGGEKKRNEILQMLVLQPRLMILDETDSGLDIDALKIVSDGINAMRSKDTATILVTHYQRLLDYVQPDHVHVLAGGRIVKSGGPELARELEDRGYAWLENAA